MPPDNRRTEVEERVRRFLEHADVGALIAYLLVGILVALAVVLLGRDLAGHLRTAETWVAAQGVVGLVLFVALFTVVTSTLFPESVLSMAAGALFGVARGLGLVVVGSLVAAAFQYGLARWLLRARIQRVLESMPSLAAIQRAVLHDEIRLQALLRLTPLSPASISYVLGAAGVRLKGFLLTCFAFVPTLFVEVYFGYTGKHVAGIAESDTGGALARDILIGVGLLACIAVMVRISGMARKAVLEAVEADEE